MDFGRRVTMIEKGAAMQWMHEADAIVGDTIGNDAASGAESPCEQRDLEPESG